MGTCSNGSYRAARLLAMGRVRKTEPVKLFCGLISGDEGLLKRAAVRLTRIFGEADILSDVWPFDQTDYYREEMGPDLLRQFVSFGPLIDPGRLAEIKRQTNELETRLADETAALEIERPVNIDPGYLTPAKLVLATTKDRGHRIYLSSGIYAEVTLVYASGAWQPLEWTYPDYRKPQYHAFFERVRQRLLEQRRAAERGEPA